MATTISPDATVALPFGSQPRLARLWLAAWRFMRRQPLGSASAAVLLAMIVAAVLAGSIAPYSPTKNDVGPTLADPSLDHLFGTDQFGRDLFSRVVYGARISLYVGLTTTLIGVTIASVLGAVSGYFGGLLDYGTQRLVDAAQAIPPLVLLIGVLIVLGPSITNVVIALSLRNALSLARVIRGAVLGVKFAPFVEASRSVGASHVRMLALHIMPNVMPTVIVLISTSIGANILAEASLSFLGYGVPPPDPTWGAMISSEGRLYMLSNPWMLVFPTVALSMVVYAMNMFGDALRDEIDPRMRGAR